MKAKFWTIPALAAASMALSGCAPEQVPFGASPDWTLKNGVIWYWQHEVTGGCVDWMAHEMWVSTRIAVAAQCADRDSKSIREAPGLRYSSSFDELTFTGYFDWTPELSSEQIVFDKDGMWKGTKPCPFAITQGQVDEMLAITREASAQADTPQEQAVYTRIEERLEATDGTKLASGQWGCEHRPDDADWQDVRVRPNPWEDG